MGDDFTTSDPTPELSGVVSGPDAVYHVRVYDGETLLAQVDSDVWSYWIISDDDWEDEVSLSVGEHALTFTATDDAGNEGGESYELYVTIT
jgi:hypothetical protein